MRDVEAATQPTATETSGEVTESVTAVGTNPESTSEGTPTPPETGDGERDESGRYLSREAASYRRRLRETEAERDQLREQLDRVQTAEVERLASGVGFAEPHDVWAFGAELATLRGEDGSIDAETVEGLVTDIIKSRPGLQAQPVGSFGMGKGGTASGRSTRQEIGLSALFGKG
jgi:hypothetical protein